VPYGASDVVSPRGDPSPSRAVIVHDGACVLCARSIAWVAAHDPQARFTYTASGSRTAAELLRPSGLDPAAPGTVVLVEDGQIFTRSDAALRIVRALPGWPAWLGVFRFVPRPVRDAIYLAIARNRHRLNPSGACPIPSADVRARTLP
jgi:predicted DCC family thiol-disulfide oxidoreductase YuxK